MGNNFDPNKPLTLNYKDRLIIWGVALLSLIIIFHNNLSFYPHCFWVIPAYFITTMALMLGRRAIVKDWS